MRRLALVFAVAAATASITAPAAAAPPSVKEIVDDLIVCVMAPCP